MSQPPSFSTAEEYFEACISFFKQFQFLYNYHNTDVLLNNVLDKIHVENLEDLEFFATSLSLPAEDEGFMRDYAIKYSKIHVNHCGYVWDKKLETVAVPLGPKKKHEIVYLAKEIKVLCQKLGCDTVVDFGSGLGYLDQRIYETTKFKVLGLECNENHYVAAKKRQRQYHKNSQENVKFIKYTINGQSQGDIRSFVIDKFGMTEFCITGLHSCADLSIDAMNLFIKMSEAKCMIIMPCCYHKMHQVNGRFDNFPLSNCMKAVYEKYEAWEFLTVPFMRLGAQPSYKYMSLEDSGFNLMARAVLQLYAHTHNCKIHRNKRKAVKTNAMENDFENYIQGACQGFSLINDKDETVQFDLNELRTIWRQITTSSTMNKAGVLICLQNVLQVVVENLILFDRLMYLRENGIEKCYCKKILNDDISPRALALVAYK